MPILVNHFAALRNPERLTRLCRTVAPRSGSAERRFLGALFHQDAEVLRPLFLVVGGFVDGVQGMARAIVEQLPADVGERCDVFYREHDEGTRMLALLEFYGSRGKKIFLTGHSWGGSSLVLDAVAKASVPVDLLATLDPVDWRKRPAPLPQVRRWLNVYVDYGKAPVTISNTVARIGRPWERLEAATENCEFVGGRHEAAEAMFAMHILEPLRSALAEE